MRRRFSVLGATMLLVAAMMVASVPPVFAEDGGCQNGQDQALLNFYLKSDNDEQASKHNYKMLDCYFGVPPGEGQ